MPNTGARSGTLKPYFLVATVFLILVSQMVASGADAQRHEERVDYYRSPYPDAVQIDPLGFLLGRVGARFEFRIDPLISRYFEFAYQPNLNKVKNGIIAHAVSLGFGERIYLRDNAAMVGLFAGANLALALISASALNARLTVEIGYKLPLAEKSHFFVEPELLIDAYLIHHENVSKIFPYVAIPIGYAW